MVQSYLLGGAFIQNQTKEELWYGYTENRFQYIFRNATDPNDDFFEGNDIDVDPHITPVLPQQSPRLSDQTVSIYTGSIDMDQVAKVRFLNMKDYININLPIYD